MRIELYRKISKYALKYVFSFSFTKKKRIHNQKIKNKMFYLIPIRYRNILHFKLKIKRANSYFYNYYFILEKIIKKWPIVEWVSLWIFLNVQCFRLYQTININSIIFHI